MKRYIAILAMMASVLAGCERKHNWTPGEPDATGTIGVYFDESNSRDVVLIPGKSDAVEIFVHRIVKDVAMDVPLISSSSVEGLVFPNSIHFDAGQTDASFLIDCSNLPQKVRAKYCVGVPDEYLMLYNDSRLNSHDGSILISAWESANNDGSSVRFIFTENNCINSTSTPASYIYRSIDSDMEVLPGAGMYRIKNFLGGGSDFVFTLSASPYPKFKGYYRIMPQEEYYYTFADAYDDESYGEAYYNAWFVLDGEEEYITPSFEKLDGTFEDTDSIGFYWYSDSNSSEFSYVRLAGNGSGVTRCSASMWTSIGSDYLYLYFSWDKSAQ